MLGLSQLGPRVPGGVAAPKARKSRRCPNLQQLRRERQVAKDDEAAATGSPFSTLRLAAEAWAALDVGPWVLRAILYGLRIPWVSTPAPTRSKGYSVSAAELPWCVKEVKRWVHAGYVRRISAAAGAESAWVSPTSVVHGPNDGIVRGSYYGSLMALHGCPTEVLHAPVDRPNAKIKN